MDNPEQAFFNGTQTYNLKWTNHTNNILNVLTENLIKECLVDVTLTCEGQYIKAHKMILSACSLYFQEVFQIHAKENAVIIVNGVSFNVLRQVVEFMYRGEIKVAGSDLESLLSFAESLQIKGLCNVRGKSPPEESENAINDKTLTENGTSKRRKRKNSFSLINRDVESESTVKRDSSPMAEFKKSKCETSSTHIETLDLTSEENAPSGDDSNGKMSPNRIPRPPNAFMIFANEWRKKLASKYPNESNKEISIRLGNKWKSLPNETKNTYFEAAKQADQQHKEKYPGYYYSPQEARLRKLSKPNLLVRRKPKTMDLIPKIIMSDSDDKIDKPDDDKIVIPDCDVNIITSDDTNSVPSSDADAATLNNDTNIVMPDNDDDNTNIIVPNNNAMIGTPDDDVKTVTSDTRPNSNKNDSDDDLHIVEHPVTEKSESSSSDSTTMPIVTSVFSEASVEDEIKNLAVVVSNNDITENDLNSTN